MKDNERVTKQGVSKKSRERERERERKKEGKQRNKGIVGGGEREREGEREYTTIKRNNDTYLMLSSCSSLTGFTTITSSSYWTVGSRERAIEITSHPRDELYTRGKRERVRASSFSAVEE